MPPHILCNLLRAIRRKQVLSTISYNVERNKHNKYICIIKSFTYTFYITFLKLKNTSTPSHEPYYFIYFSNDDQICNMINHILGKLEDFHILSDIKYNHFSMHISLHNLTPMALAFSFMHMRTLELYC